MLRRLPRRRCSRCSGPLPPRPLFASNAGCTKPWPRPRSAMAALAAARAEVWTAMLAGSYRATLAAVQDGRVAEARAWLLVREFRPPTRFSRPGAEGTRALLALKAGRLMRAQAVAAVRADLLDTYQGRLREALETLDGAAAQGFASRAAGEATLARGYFTVLAPSYRAQRGEAAAESATAAFDRLVAAVRMGDQTAIAAATKASAAMLAGFRAAPLAPAEEQRRAAQFQRFLGLVPVEYGRGVADGRVTQAFEIQEAITFRDGAAQAFGDLEAALSQRDRARDGAYGGGAGEPWALARHSCARYAGRRAESDRGRYPERARPGRSDLPRALAGRRVECGLRRDPRVAAAASGRGRRRRVRRRRAGAARGLRDLRARAGAAPPRAGSRAVHPCRGPVLVRRRRRGGAGAARAAKGSPGGAGGDHAGARSLAQGRRGSGRIGTEVDDGDRLEHGDHRLPRGARGSADPGSAPGRDGR